MFNPKSGKRTKVATPNSEYEAEKQKPVAFVICYPIESGLIPITSEISPCLVPLCNSPVLLYVLNWLNVNGFEKIYLLCPNHQFSEFITKIVEQCCVRMLMNSIQTITVSEPVDSYGNVTQPIDSYGKIIRFLDSYLNTNNIDITYGILVPGTLITNIAIKPIMDNFIQRFTQSRSHIILNAVFTQTTKSNGYTGIFSDDDVILHIQNSSEYLLGTNPNPLTIPQDIIKSNKKFKIKTGLCDSNIYIFNYQFLANFSSNFDWDSVIEDCITSQILDKEFYQHLTIASFFPDAFAANVNDLPSYLNASLAVIRRWLYPVTIEMNFFPPTLTESLLYADLSDLPQASEYSLADSNEDCTAFRLERDLVYLHDNVFPSLSAKVGHSVVIGSGTIVNAGAIIRNTVIGSDCVIGEGVELDHCIIWDHVTIEAGAKIKYSVIASSSTVASGVHIDFGCLISFSCPIEADLPPCRRVTSQPNLNQNGTFGDLSNSGFSYRKPPNWLSDYISAKEPLPLSSNLEYQEFTPNPIAELGLLQLWLDLGERDFPISQDDLKEVDEESDNAFDQFADEEEDAQDYVQVQEEFVHEATNMLIDFYRSNEKPDQIQTEMVSFKNANYLANIDIAVAIIQMIVSEFPASLDEGVKTMKFLLKIYLEDNSDQEDLLFWLQQWCAKNFDQRKDTFVELIDSLQDIHIISQDAIVSWSDPDQQNDASANQRAAFEYYSKEGNFEREEEDNQ